MLPLLKRAIAARLLRGKYTVVSGVMLERLSGLLPRR